MFENCQNNWLGRDKWQYFTVSHLALYIFALVLSLKNDCIQECIPVGCVPAAHWPYTGVCFPGGGGGVCSGGVCSEGCLLGEGVSAPRGGVSAPKGEGVCSGGVCSGGVWYPSMHWGRHPPPCEQNDRQVQKYYVGHNFVAAGKNY